MRFAIFQAAAVSGVLLGMLPWVWGQPQDKEEPVSPRAEKKQAIGASEFAVEQAGDAITQTVQAQQVLSSADAKPEQKQEAAQTLQNSNARAAQLFQDHPNNWKVGGLTSLQALQAGDKKTAIDRATRSIGLAQEQSAPPRQLADVLNTRAVAYAASGDYGRAHADAARVLKEFPDDVIASDLEKLTRDKNLPSRVRLLENGQEQALPPQLVSLLGRLREQSVVTRPAGFSSSVAATKRADTAVQLGDWDAMYAKADAALKQLPDNPRAYMQRAFASLMLKKYERAIADATAGLKLQPKSASLYGVRAAAYNGSGQPAKALADAQKAVENDPKDPVGWLQRGLAREKLGAPEEQWVADIKEAAELDPDNFADQYREALARRGQGQPEGAGAPGAVDASGEGGGLLAGFLAPINRRLQSMPKADAERLVLRAAWSLVGGIWALVLFLLARALKRRRTSIRRATDQM